ncbi:MAG: transporter [Formosa sp.]|jgi:predicted RND superfamily exporter protein|nr:transporter [Formosa sp.]|tara:strand:+ start:5291 stop:7687 length:2397 start_codon:yes stop_codon:yes gene_type:complete
MLKLFSTGFWNALARLILRNRVAILVLIGLFTALMVSQWGKMRFSYTEANLLPDDHFVNLDYNRFLEIFGEEGNLIVLGVKDSRLFSVENLNAWNRFSKSFENNPNVETIVTLQDLKKLVKNKRKQQFDFIPFIKDSLKTTKELEAVNSAMLNDFPFYDNILFNKESKAIRSVLLLDKSIVNSPARKSFIVDNLIPKVKAFEKQYGLDVRVSGMPYARTLNSQNIIDEIEVFLIAAIIITSLIFFFFFRSYRATFISMCVVVIGVMWTFGILGFLEYEITVLTALIPPLIIVIGVPNCIFLINKYQHEFNKHGNKAKSLQRVITKVGNATLMTNTTTASGFATFIITQSKLLIEFGTVASLSIMAIFSLCLLVIPIVYSYMPMPNEKHLEHLNKRWINTLGDWIETTVKQKNIAIYIISVLLLVVSIIGIYQIKTSGSLLEDMPKNAEFYQDIQFYEAEFNGIMPLEILINTKRKKGVLKPVTLKKMSALEDLIVEIPELSKPISIVSLVKYSKQAFYNGNPKYYQLPTTQENGFILSYAKNSSNDLDLLHNYVDSTGQYARITTFIKDDGMDQMDQIEDRLNKEITKLFDEDRYEVSLTGKAFLFQKGTNFLIKNLILSLTLAILLISLFMAYLFRSFRMIVISLTPNLLPLLITAGAMGFLGVPIKPSTILVFSIAFGISVDDTIHFLAKYRQELIACRWSVKKSVFAALRETGISMFYTSIVLFFGFSVFTTSNFGGTVAMGALVSGTLLLAMMANLLLLPVLLLSLERNIANKKVLKEPSLKIIPEDINSFEED